MRLVRRYHLRREPEFKAATDSGLENHHGSRLERSPPVSFPTLGTRNGAIGDPPMAGGRDGDSDDA